MDGKSKDMTQEYIEQIKALFPEVVTEVAHRKENDENNSNSANGVQYRVDMEKLALLLGEVALPSDEADYRQKYGEKFTFEWAGKRRAIAEAQKRSTGTLRPCPEDSVDWDSTENLYIEGDNLEVLKLMQDSYLGAVKMIYIDPPYNTGKDFVYKDNYKDNLTNYLEMTNTTNAVNTEASGRYHTNWLNMMYPRLKLARNILSDDGVIFISIDDNEVSNLKTICDEIFGEDNFIGQWNWFKSATPPNLSKKIKKNIEYIVCYQKGNNKNVFKGIVKTSSSDDPFTKPQNTIKTLTFPIGSINAKLDDGTYKAGVYGTDKFPNELINDIIIQGGINVNEVSFKNKFIWVQEKLNEEIQNGTRISLSKSLVLSYKKADYGAEVPPNLIDSSVNVDTTENAGKNLDAIFDHCSVFDYPKPISLIKYLINFDCDTNSLILDFFSGSATTAHAVMQLNAEDGGNRKYICVQLPEQTPEESEARKAGFATIPEIAKERIRRAGKKIVEEQKAKAEKEGNLFSQNEEAQKLDIGFKVFKLDRSNVKEWDVEFDGLNETQAGQQLKAEFNKAMDILKDGRTEQDLLYEVMLKLGLQLSTKVETKEIDGKTAFVVGNGVMIASFAKGLTSAQIGKMLDLKADFVQASEFKVVLADESFATDNDKTNAMQLFKQRGITNYEII